MSDALPPGLTDEQKKAIEAQKARAAELVVVANTPVDPNAPQLDRVETLLKRADAQTRLVAMGLQQLSLAGGMSGGLKDVIKEATSKLEPYAEIFRTIEGYLDELRAQLDPKRDGIRARVDRLEANLKADIESRGGTYRV